MKSLRKFGAEAIMMFNQDTIDEKVEVFSSGSYLLNNALGIGGYPKGRIVEIYGPESSGKTTLCLQCNCRSTKTRRNSLLLLMLNMLLIHFMQEI